MRNAAAPTLDVRDDFYGSTLTAAEQIELEAARKVEGLDEEIAVLRVRLRQALDEHKEDLPLLVQGMGLLVRAVSTRYRLSPKAEEDLSASLAKVIQNVGGLLLPEGLGDE